MKIILQNVQYHALGGGGVMEDTINRKSPESVKIWSMTKCQKSKVGE